MSTLIGIIFENNRSGAETALSKLGSMSGAYTKELEDSIITTRSADGKIELNQSTYLAHDFTWAAGLWGALIGVIVGGPLGWVVLGAAGAGFGALIDQVADFGIDDNFITDLSSEMHEDSSCLFLLVRSMTEETILGHLEGLGGKIIMTSLPIDAEERLQETLLKETPQANVKKKIKGWVS